MREVRDTATAVQEARNLGFDEIRKCGQVYGLAVTGAWSRSVLFLERTKQRAPALGPGRESEDYPQRNCPV